MTVSNEQAQPLELIVDKVFEFTGPVVFTRQPGGTRLKRTVKQGKPSIDIEVSEEELLTALGISEPGYRLLIVQGTGPYTLHMVPWDG